MNCSANVDLCGRAASIIQQCPPNVLPFRFDSIRFDMAFAYESNSNGKPGPVVIKWLDLTSQSQAINGGMPDKPATGCLNLNSNSNM